VCFDSDLDSENTSQISKNPTQIERILESISNIVDFSNLEPIRHFFFAPWARELPYKVQISLKPKDIEENLHLEYLKSICNSNTTIIYTDGSQLQNGLGIGLGFAVFDYSVPYIPTIPTYKEYQNIGNSTIVYNGELEGITRALEYAISIVKRGENLVVFSDNQAALLRLKSPSDKPGQNQQIRAIDTTKAIIAKGAKVELAWVPGYSDVLGNEIADQLAKKGALSSLDQDLKVRTSFAFLGIRLNGLKRQDIEDILALQKPASN